MKKFYIFLILSALIMQTACVRCLLDLPPIAKTKMYVPTSISTKELFKIIEEASFGVIQPDREYFIKHPYTSIEKPVYSIKNGTLKIGDIYDNSVGLKLFAKREKNTRVLFLQVGGYGPYCKNTLNPQGKLSELSNKIKKKILQYKIKE